MNKTKSFVNGWSESELSLGPLDIDCKFEIGNGCVIDLNIHLLQFLLYFYFINWKHPDSDDNFELEFFKPCFLEIHKFNDEYGYQLIFEWLPLGDGELRNHIKWIKTAYNSENK